MVEERSRAGFPPNSIRICFSNCNPGRCEGEICGVALEEEIKFHSMVELIVKIDDAFNEIGRPQPHQVLRSFQNEEGYQSYKSEPKFYHDSEEISERTGQKTVDFVMLFRHKAEWQGIIKSVTGEVIGSFNNSLECLEVFQHILEN